MAGYYYRQLDREKRAVYDAMRTGMEALAPGIRVPKLTGQELSDIYLRLKLDTPLLFYVTGFQYRWMPGADHVELLPEYLFDKNKVRQHRQAVAARLDRLVRPLAGKTDREKELAIHGFILENVRYDKLKKPYSHEIIGPLTQGVGVCEGIAKTVKALCDAVGLPCIVALSEAAPERGVKYRHTWNVVTVEGQRYHLDATFDNSLQRGVPRYDYFNLDDRHIFRDHETLVLPLPPCTADKGYYLPGPVLHQARGRGKPRQAGPAEKAGALRVPLAGRRSEPGAPDGPADPVRRRSPGAGQVRQLLREHRPGRGAAGLHRRARGGGGAGAAAGRGKRTVNIPPECSITGRNRIAERMAMTRQKKELF